MKKGLFVGLVAAVAALAGAGGAAAQSLPISVEARLDAGVPVGDAADLYEQAIGFGIHGAFQATPLFAFYGGFSRFEFEREDDLGERKSEGLEVGGRVTLGRGGGVYNPFFQIGGLVYEDDTRLWGGFGGFYPVGRNLSVTPMIRYRTIDELDYVALGVGVNLRF